jgi:hypothetical protein
MDIVKREPDSGGEASPAPLQCDNRSVDVQFEVKYEAEVSSLKRFIVL